MNFLEKILAEVNDGLSPDSRRYTTEIARNFYKRELSGLKKDVEIAIELEKTTNSINTTALQELKKREAIADLEFKSKVFEQTLNRIQTDCLRMENESLEKAQKKLDLIYFKGATFVLATVKIHPLSHSPNTKNPNMPWNEINPWALVRIFFRFEDKPYALLELSLSSINRRIKQRTVSTTSLSELKSLLEDGGMLVCNSLEGLIKYLLGTFHRDALSVASWDEVEKLSLLETPVTA